MTGLPACNRRGAWLWPVELGVRSSGRAGTAHAAEIPKTRQIWTAAHWHLAINPFSLASDGACREANFLAFPLVHCMIAC